MIQQYHLPLPQKESMGLEDFLPSDANEQAVHWLVQSDPASWSSHALVLWGPEGSGKTHLLNIWREKMSAELVRPKSNVLDKLVAGEDDAPAYILDDVDSIAGDSEAEEWLQHFYNATKAEERPLLLSAKKPPLEWGLKLPDILTRLKSCQTVALQEPDDMLIHGLLLKLFQDRQLMVDVGVVDYIAARLERTGNAVRAAVAKLDESALEGHRKISIPFAQKVLGWKIT